MATPGTQEPVGVQASEGSVCGFWPAPVSVWNARPSRPGVDPLYFGPTYSGEEPDRLVFWEGLRHAPIVRRRIIKRTPSQRC